MMKALRILPFIILYVIAYYLCVHSAIKLAPEHKGVDPKLRSFYDQYMWLSRHNNIRFHKKVTIGFKNINHGNIIGLCTSSGLFREIDIDINYWNNSTKTSKMTLLFHELTHCYCGRGHDYGRNKVYPEEDLEENKNPGYYNDGCPVSIMYPTLVDDICMVAHYQSYVGEMFLRCKPW